MVMLVLTITMCYIVIKEYQRKPRGIELVRWYYHIILSVGGFVVTYMFATTAINNF